MGGGSKVRGAPAANPPPSHSQIFFPDAEILRMAEQLELFFRSPSAAEGGRGENSLSKINALCAQCFKAAERLKKLPAQLAARSQH